MSSDQSKSASDILAGAVGAFCRAITSNHGSATEAMHRTISGMHALTAEIAKCEGKLPEAELRGILQPAVDLHSEAPFVKRLQQWPRGYAGDFETIEYLVSGVPGLDASHRAFWIEWYALHTAIGQQHRNKIQFQADQIRSLAGVGRDRRVASIGCGGGADLALLQDVLPILDLTLIDIDGDALRLATTRSQTARSVTAVQGDAIRALRRTEEPFNLILFGGLFDYLPDRYVVSLLRLANRKLSQASDARIVFTNINGGNPFRPWLCHLASWDMIERSAGELAVLCGAAGLSDESLRITKDATGLALLATAGRSPRDNQTKGQRHG